MLFPTLKKKYLCKKKIYSGIFFFFRKSILSDFTFYAIFSIEKKYIEKCPFTYWLNGRWFLQIVQLASISIYPLFPCSDFVSQMWRWFGGGGGGAV